MDKGKNKMLIINGRCMTMTPERESLERAAMSELGWLEAENGRITSLGAGIAYPHPAAAYDRVLDAKGGTVLPGFIDSHFHVVQTALNSLSLDLSQARSFEDIGELIRQAGAKNPEESILGIRLDWQNLREGRMPDRSVLDRFWSESPVWINSIDYQKSVLNTYALLYYKIPFTVEGVQCDEKQMPTGVFRENANAMLRGNILRSITDFYRMEALENMVPGLLEKGITTVNAMEGGALYCDRDAEFIFERTKCREFPLDIELFYQTMDLERISQMGLSRVGGSLYVDGTFSARTAAVSFEYADSPGRMGELRFSREKLNEFVCECYRRKLQLALYTVGDRAIELALSAHEYALSRTGNTGLRHRLEHVEILAPKQIEKAVDMGILFSMQPSYELYWGGAGRMYEQRLGEHYKRTNPFAEIVEAGGLICGGSDSDVTSADPLLGIYGAVSHPVACHRVGVYDALKMFTVNGAYAVFCEKQKGMLAPGMAADIVVLDRDIMNTPPDQIKEARVRAAVKSGKVKYEAL